MRGLLERMPPTFPEVALLVEPPRALGLRVVKGRAGTEPVAWFDEPLPTDGEGIDAGTLAERATVSLGMPPRLALVLDDALSRSQVLTLADFPGREEERQQVLRWHLRKVLNLTLDDVRLRYQILQRQGRSVTLWLSMGPEGLLASLEAAFLERGTHVGFIGTTVPELYNRALSRGALPEEGTCLLVNRTPRALSFLFAEGGVPRFFRCKEIAAWELEGGEDEERLAQEVRLTLAYQRERLGGAPLRTVFVRQAGAGLSLPLEEDLAEGATILQLAREVPAPAGFGDRAERAMPLLGVLEG